MTTPRSRPKILGGWGPDFRARGSQFSWEGVYALTMAVTLHLAMRCLHYPPKYHRQNFIKPKRPLKFLSICFVFQGHQFSIFSPCKFPSSVYPNHAALGGPRAIGRSRAPCHRRAARPRGPKESRAINMAEHTRGYNDNASRLSSWVRLRSCRM